MSTAWEPSGSNYILFLFSGRSSVCSHESALAFTYLAEKGGDEATETGEEGMKPQSRGEEGMKPQRRGGGGGGMKPQRRGGGGGNEGTETRRRRKRRRR
jgi:hypothetical protein